MLRMIHTYKSFEVEQKRKRTFKEKIAENKKQILFGIAAIFIITTVTVVYFGINKDG